MATAMIKIPAFNRVERQGCEQFATREFRDGEEDEIARFLPSTVVSTVHKAVE